MYNLKKIDNINIHGRRYAKAKARKLCSVQKEI